MSKFKLTVYKKPYYESSVLLIWWRIKSNKTLSVQISCKTYHKISDTSKLQHWIHHFKTCMLILNLKYLRFFEIMTCIGNSQYHIPNIEAMGLVVLRQQYSIHTNKNSKNILTGKLKILTPNTELLFRYREFSDCF